MKYVGCHQYLDVIANNALEILALDCKTQQIVTLKDKQRLRHDVGNKTPLLTIITKSRSTIDINWSLLRGSRLILFKVYSFKKLFLLLNDCTSSKQFSS